MAHPREANDHRDTRVGVRGVQPYDSRTVPDRFAADILDLTGAGASLTYNELVGDFLAANPVVTFPPIPPYPADVAELNLRFAATASRPMETAPHSRPVEVLLDRGGRAEWVSASWVDVKGASRLLTAGWCPDEAFGFWRGAVDGLALPHPLGWREPMLVLESATTTIVTPQAAAWREAVRARRAQPVPPAARAGLTWIDVAAIAIVAILLGVVFADVRARILGYPPILSDAPMVLEPLQ